MPKFVVKLVSTDAEALKAAREAESSARRVHSVLRSVIQKSLEVYVPEGQSLVAVQFTDDEHAVITTVPKSEEIGAAAYTPESL